MAFKKESFQPNVDASYGLIYRLNALWSRADNSALEGDMEKWNFVLDRIYSNLLYRNPLEIDYTVDKDGKPQRINKVGLLQEDFMIYARFRKEIREIKHRILIAVKKRNKAAYNHASEDLYQTLMLKDIWLRKFMQERNLYLKETQFNPANAMWGG